MTAAADFEREADLLCEVAEGCRATGRRLLFFSTASAGMYGAVAGPAREDDPVEPCNAYGAHKHSLEQRLRASGADHLILRLTHTVGPGMPPHQLVPTLVRHVRAGTVRIDRLAARDLIGIGDAVAIIDRLLALDLPGETVNVASGQTVPLEHIVDHLERRLGAATRRIYRDSGMGHLVSIDKLRGMVPEVAGMDFGPGYYRRVLDAHADLGVFTA